MDNHIVSALENDSYTSILKKILSQNTLEKKAGVYLLFEYTRPHIVHSELFLEYLRIWDKELYDFLTKHHYRFKKRSLKESILDYSILILVYSKKIFVYTSYILISILIIVIVLIFFRALFASILLAKSKN